MIDTGQCGTDLPASIKTLEAIGGTHAHAINPRTQAHLRVSLHHEGKLKRKDTRKVRTLFAELRGDGALECVEEPEGFLEELPDIW